MWKPDKHIVSGIRTLSDQEAWWHEFVAEFHELCGGESTASGSSGSPVRSTPNASYLTFYSCVNHSFQGARLIACRLQLC